MKLSEALILGEFVVPPVKNHFFSWSRGQLCGACAVGRGCLAAGFKPNAKHIFADTEALYLAKFMGETWPWTNEWYSNSRVKYYELNRVLAEISDRYEKCGQSMQEIAAWIATIEPPDTPVAPEPSTEAVTTHL